MSLVLANIDADFQITYVFNGFENVGSTKNNAFRNAGVSERWF